MKKKLIIFWLVVVALVIGAIFYSSSVGKKASLPNQEAYVAVANVTDGPEQIFEKAFAKYCDAHGIKVTEDELRKVAEYMAEQNLRGKAYWTDANGVRHELWIGTGDTLVVNKNTSTFKISNAITENQKKSIVINFGFEEAQAQLVAIRAVI